MVENKLIRECIICIPDVTCKMVGVLGKVKARITTIPNLHQEFIVWDRIEECSIRKQVMEEIGQRHLAWEIMQKIDNT